MLQSRFARAINILFVCFYKVFDKYYCLKILILFYVFIYVTLGYDAECMDEICTPRGTRAHFL
jgi:hypothetical protein